MTQDKPAANDPIPSGRVPHPQDSPTSSDCGRVLALIPAYSIGATDPDEDAFIKAKLAECPEAAAELSSYMKLAEAMHYSAVPALVPPSLANTLQASIRSLPSPQPGALSSQRGAPSRAQRAFVRTLSRPYWIGLALGAGLLIVLLVLTINLLTEINQVRGEQELVAARLHDQDRALMLIGLGASNRIVLPAVQTGGQIAPFAAIVWDPQGEYALLYVKNFPALQPNQTYQLWLEHDGQQTSAGAFLVDDDGLGTLLFRSTTPIPTFDAIEITAEPAGSSKPTTPPIVRRQR